MINNSVFNTPILFLIFNRPSLFRRTFRQIGLLKPKRLFVAGDGPRDGFPKDKKKCRESQEIVKQADWGCKVETLFRKKHLGCKKAVSSAVSWFFKNVKEGIIIEDDCLLDKSFFYFCQVLLKKYREDERVMHISANNFQNGIKRGNASYYFSKIPHVWGWAGWRRAWEYYDVTMKDFLSFKKQEQIKNIFIDKNVQKKWVDIFQKTYNGGVDTWDFQWTYAIFKQNGLCVTPNVNLVTNIGFSPSATHTSKRSPFINMNRGRLNKIKHPQFVLPDNEADFLIMKRNFGVNFFSRNIKFILKHTGRILQKLNQIKNEYFTDK